MIAEKFCKKVIFVSNFFLKKLANVGFFLYLCMDICKGRMWRKFNLKRGTICTPLEILQITRGQIVPHLKTNKFMA